MALLDNERPGFGYGKRTDGTEKGQGYLGEQKTTDGSGRVATELSIGVEMDGKEIEIPSLVPTLTEDEKNHLLSGKPATKEIISKAVDFAKQRLASGQSQYADNPGQTDQLATPMPLKRQFGLPSADQQMDALLTDAVSRGELPPKQAVLDAIKAGQFTIDEVKADYKQFKNAQEVPTAPEAAPKNPEDVMNSFRSSFTGGVATSDKDGVMNKVGDIYKAALADIKEDKPTFRTPEYKSMKETGSITQSISQYFLDLINSEYEKDKYVAKKLATGLSLNIYDSEDEAPDKTTAVMGAVAELVGFGVSTYFAGKYLKKVPVIGPALSKLGTKAEAAAKAVTKAEAAGEAVGFGAKAAKHGLQMASIAAEGAAIGFGTGTAKGVIEGENVGEILERGLMESALFAGGGVALYPVATGGVALMEKGFKKIGGKFGYATRAKGLAKQAEDLVAENPAYYVEKLSKMEQTPEVQEALRYANAALKIRASGVEAGPFPMADRIKSPDALKAIFKGREDDLKTIATTMFEETPLQALYQSNEKIKYFIDKGEYAEAIMAGQVFFREQMKKNKTVQEWITSPFVNDSKFIYEAMAERHLAKLDPVEYPVASRNLITNYMEDLVEGTATKKDLKNLRNVVAGEDKTARKSFGLLAKKEKFFDARLKPDEADQIIGKVMDEYLGTLSAKATGLKETPFGTMSQIVEAADSQKMLRAAIFANRQLSNNLVQAAMRGVKSFEERFEVVDPALMSGLKDEIAIKTNTLAVSNQIKHINELNKLLKIKNIKLMSKRELAKAAKAGTETTEAMALSQQIHTLKAEVSNLYKKINVSKSNLDNLDPEIAAKITETANSIYVPGFKDLGYVAKDQAGINALKRRSDFLGRFEFKDSNVFIKAEDELVDMIGAMNYTGLDIPKSFYSTLKGPTVVNPDNLRRLAQREFGYNNPLEGYFGLLKDAEINVNKYKQTVLDQLKNTGVKEGSKESEFIFRAIEDKKLLNSEEFLKLKPDVQKRILDGKEVIRSVYDKTLDDINVVMKRFNLPEVAKRADYITHYGEVMEDLPKMIKDIEQFGKTEEILKRYNIKFSNRIDDPTKTFFRFEKPRTGIETTKDAIGAMKRYIGPAAERIFYTPLMRATDTAKVFSTGENMQKMFQYIKDNVILKEFSDTAATKGWQKALSFGMQKLAGGALMGSVNFMLQQIASTPLSLIIGGRDAIYATVNRFTKESAEVMKLSKNLNIREKVDWTDVDARLFDSALEGVKKINSSAVGKGIKKVSGYWDNMTKFAANIFDKEAASHAFRTGVSYAKRQGITDKKVQAYIGDHFTDMLQASFSKVDRPFGMDHIVARAFMQFQSFSMNLAATIMTDLPMMAKQESAGRVVKGILRTAAGASIVNELAEEIGMPKPFNMSTFIPGASTFRFGVPGVIGLYRTGLGLAYGDTKAKKEIGRTLATMSVKGGGQLYKVGEAILDTEASPEDRIKGAIFGMSTQRKYAREAEAKGGKTAPPLPKSKKFGLPKMKKLPKPKGF